MFRHHFYVGMLTREETCFTNIKHSYVFSFRFGANRDTVDLIQLILKLDLIKQLGCLVSRFRKGIRLSELLLASFDQRDLSDLLFQSVVENGNQFFIRVSL